MIDEWTKRGDARRTKEERKAGRKKGTMESRNRGTKEGRSEVKSLLLLEEALILRNFGKNEHRESRCIITSNKHAKQKKRRKVKQKTHQVNINLVICRSQNSIALITLTRAIGIEYNLRAGRYCFED